MPPDGFETEMYEMEVPGKLVGKEIIDADARRIGICHSIKLRVSTGKKGELHHGMLLVIKGLDIEFDMTMDDVDIIGNVIKLKVPARQADELDVRDVIRIQEEIAGEIRSRASKV
ncbi:hypothetical protein GF325_01135 [Candidatus Bathyarchaeota archaeon]|nr:hypothetical protein [Candidatus Bathyarchaeota archaeon]